MRHRTLQGCSINSLWDSQYKKVVFERQYQTFFYTNGFLLGIINSLTENLTINVYINIRYYSLLFVTIRDYSQYSVIIRFLSPAAVVSYARLPYCIDFLLEHGANCKRFFGILDLTTGCLIRLCHDVNDDVAIFTKLSLVFPCSKTTLIPLTKQTFEFTYTDFLCHLKTTQR